MPNERKWQVQLAPTAVRDVRSYDIDDRRFRPSLRQVLDDLKRAPLRFPKKRGKLKNARSASLRFAGTAWRVVFVTDEERQFVRILAIGRHDVAYERAERRI